MKAYFREKYNIFLISLLLFVLWRIFLIIPGTMARYLIPFNPVYVWISHWANFDGIHYLFIARRGYAQWEQAFFPLFSLLIYLLKSMLNSTYLLAGHIITYASSLGALYMLIKLLRIDFKKDTLLWPILFFLAFPTAFFLVSVYTESLFLFLVLLSFYLVRRKQAFWGSIVGALASATRLVGILLLPALLFEIYEQYKEKKITKRQALQNSLALLLVSVGLLSYMYYLWRKYGDPLLFIHTQPIFGAGRSGGNIVLLPQVLWRYGKIFVTVPISSLTWWVGLLEVCTLCLVLVLLYLAYRRGVRRSYILFSVLALLLPTLSGTLSSLPRYALVCFAIYPVLGMISRPVLRYSLLGISLALQCILVSLFLQGYFVA